jgi:carotenoid cleavage dioxygenase-like enzyme
MHSELVIGDTRNLAAGPLARVRLPFKAPGQVHGNWVPQWALDA